MSIASRIKLSQKPLGNFSTVKIYTIFELFLDFQNVIYGLFMYSLGS